MNEREKEIKEILEREFSPIFLEVIDESYLHAGHREAKPGKSTHFRVTIVSEKFENVLPVKQHRLVYESLKEQLNSGVHALSLKTIKPSQY